MLVSIFLLTKILPVSDVEKFLSNLPKTAMKEIDVLPECYAINKKIVDLHFSKNAIIAIIKRKDKYITPNGSTIIEANDKLVVLSDNPEGLDQVNECLFSGDAA